MTASSSPGFDRRLVQLGLTLPDVPTPSARFLPYRCHGGLVFLAGQICEWNGEVLYRGKVGIEHDLAGGIGAARVCALNLVAALRQACGGTLDRITGCLRVGGFVNAAPDYPQVPDVINGASDVFRDLFGAAGEHARTAVGVATLPRCAAVEVDAIFSVAT